MLGLPQVVVRLLVIITNSINQDRWFLFQLPKKSSQTKKQIQGNRWAHECFKKPYIYSRAIYNLLGRSLCPSAVCTSVGRSACPSDSRSKTLDFLGFQCSAQVAIYFLLRLLWEHTWYSRAIYTIQYNSSITSISLNPLQPICSTVCKLHKKCACFCLEKTARSTSLEKFNKAKGETLQNRNGRRNNAFKRKRYSVRLSGKQG